MNTEGDDLIEQLELRAAEVGEWRCLECAEELPLGEHAYRLRDKETGAILGWICERCKESGLSRFNDCKVRNVS